MSNIFDGVEDSWDDVEKQMRSAGLTRETVDKINNWIKNAKDKEDNDKNK